MNGVKGGQGRSDEDIYGSAVVLGYLTVAAGAATFTALIMWWLS